jgi:hypothetical protein
MKLTLLSRTLHKWLTLFVGLQLLVWALTGFYMVAVDLDFIHGDPLVRNLRTPVDRSTTVLPVSQLASRYPEVTLVALHSLPVLDAPVYELTAAGRKVLVDAAHGQQLSPLSPGMIRQLARCVLRREGSAQRRAVARARSADGSARARCAAVASRLRRLAANDALPASRHRRAGDASPSLVALVRFPVDAAHHGLQRARSADRHRA